MKILIVDDSKFQRQLLKQMLGEHEYDEASTGDEALLRIQSFPADLVFLDLIMPGTNGVIVAKKIKALRPEAKIIVQTAAGGASKTVQAALQGGAEASLTKPYEDYEIEKILNKFNAKLQKEPPLVEEEEVSDEHAGTAGS